MAELLVKVKHFQHWLMLIPLILVGRWFSWLEIKITKPEYLLYIHLDDYIPFVPLFVIPYIFWYAYVTIPAVFLFFKSPQEFAKMAAFLTLGMMIACAVYTLFPNGQALRPVLGNYDEPLVSLIRFIYSNDTPANCAPSIHVVYSVAAYIAVSRYNNLRWHARWIKNTSLIMAVLCILSTVFIKQHSIIDLVMGLFLSALLYLLIYGRQTIRPW